MAALFDVRSELADIVVTSNQKMEVNIDLKDIGDLNRKVDVVLGYFIKDFEGTEIKLGEETVGVFDSLSVRRRVPIPSKLKPGDYLFYVRLTYSGSIATSSNRFTLEGEDPVISFVRGNLVIIISALLLILLIAKRRYILSFVKKEYLIIGSSLRKLLERVYVLYLRVRYIPHLLVEKEKAGLYDEKIAKIKHLPKNIKEAVRNYVNKVSNIFPHSKYKEYLITFIKEFSEKLHVAYLRIIYIPHLLVEKEKAGLYDEKIAKIKHLPRSIIGIMGNYLNKLYSIFPRFKYKILRKFKKKQVFTSYKRLKKS